MKFHKRKPYWNKFRAEKGSDVFDIFYTAWNLIIFTRNLCSVEYFPDAENTVINIRITVEALFLIYFKLDYFYRLYY